MFDNIMLRVTDNYGSDMTYFVGIQTLETPSLGEVVTQFENDNKDQGYWVVEARYTR